MCKNCPGPGTYFVWFLGGLVVGAMAMLCGYGYGQQDVYLSAVKHNLAHWITDKNTGKAYIDWHEWKTDANGKIYIDWKD